MNVTVKLSASKSDLDEARAICEGAGVSLSRVVRDGAAQCAEKPQILVDVFTALLAVPQRQDWAQDKQQTTILMPAETVKVLSGFSRQLTTSIDWVLRMVVDGIRLGVIKPSVN